MIKIKISCQPNQYPNSLSTLIIYLKPNFLKKSLGRYHANILDKYLDFQNIFNVIIDTIPGHHLWNLIITKKL